MEHSHQKRACAVFSATKLLLQGHIWKKYSTQGILKFGLCNEKCDTLPSHEQHLPGANAHTPAGIGLSPQTAASSSDPAAIRCFLNAHKAEWQHILSSCLNSRFFVFFFSQTSGSSFFLQMFPLQIHTLHSLLQIQMFPNSSVFLLTLSRHSSLLLASPAQTQLML